jgi:RNA polymerase sigma factor (sigma-70 family)
MSAIAELERPRRSASIAALVVGAALSTFGSAPAEATINDVGRYCTACWRNARIQPDCWSDCTQDVLIRLVERVRPESWERLLARDAGEHRELIRAVDAVKKRTQRAHRSATLVDEVADVRSTHDHRRAEERALVLQTAAEHLSPRQAQILAMSLDGWSVHEIAKGLKIPAARVSDEKYKAIRRLRDELADV